MPAIATLAYGIYAAEGIIAFLATPGAAMAIISATMEVVLLASAALAYQSAKGRRGDKFSGSGYLLNTRSSEEVLPVLYGRHRIGGNQVYVNATGDNNKFLHIVMTLSEGPIEGIETIYLDGKPASDYGSLVYYEFFNGDGNQGLCSTLQAADANWSDYMRWTAYLYLRLEYDADRFSSLPEITVIAKGRKLYDPRNGVTAYSNNLALVVYDWLTSKRYGLGIDASLVNTQSIIDAANWYESQPNPYTFNGIIANRQAFLDNISEILLNGRADIIWSEGKYKLLVRKYDTPVMSLTEDDIVADSFSFSVSGLADTPNRVIVEYPREKGSDPEDLGWKPIPQVIEDSNAVLLYDNEERDLEFSLIGTTNATQANLLGIYNLERARLNDVFSFSAGPRTLALEPGDMIQVTHPVPGWTNTVVRVIDLHLSQDGNVGLTVQEEDPALYDDTLNLSPHTYFKTTLPDPLAAVPEATGVSFIEEEYFNKDVSYTRLKVTFTPPASPFWDRSEVWVNVAGAGYSHYTDARGSFTIEPVKEGVNYKVKLISVSLQDKRQDFSTATEWSYNIVGKNTPPADVTNFKAIPQSDTIVLTWDPVSAVDLQGYEIRRGTNWNGGIFIEFTRAVATKLNGVAPGTHTFMIKAVDTNGKYSSNYPLASATVYGPASYTEKMSELNEFGSPSAWAASTPYALGAKVTPTTPNGFYYKCTVAGTSGLTQPTWPTTNGATVTDGGITWTAYEDQVFTNMERYNDPQSGWELYVIHESDEFNSPTKQDLKAGGDGAKRHGWNVLNSGNADAIDVSTTNNGKLTVDLNANDSVFWDATFSGAFAYKSFAGDFNVETYISSSNHDAYNELSGLFVRDPNASAGEDWLGITTGYSGGAVTNTVNTVNSVSSVAQAVAAHHPYLRITRVGNVFTLYSKLNSTDAWTQRGQYTRNDFGSSVQVGLGAQSNNTSNTFVIQFDYFRKTNGNLSGTYTSPVYDRGSIATRRSWPAFDYLFEGTGATWADQFLSSDLWNDKLGANDTWLDLFGAYVAGTLKMELGVSSNGTSWTWYPNLESYTIEQQARYVRYKVYITDEEAGGYLHAKAITWKEAYWV